MGRTLPTEHFNQELVSLDVSRLPPVKFQQLDRDGSVVLVGRMKIPTGPTTHAFILRRFDTQAISLTTMFRAAFPNSTDADEKLETQYAKNNFNLSKNNGTSAESLEGKLTRLAGTWVTPEQAKIFAEEYGIRRIVDILAAASPDPNVEYRRPSKLTSTTPKSTTSQSGLVTPVAKRRREEAAPTVAVPTPVVSPPVVRTRRGTTPLGAASAAATIAAAAAKATSPPPRRSSRKRSLPPEAIPATVLTTPKNAAKVRIGEAVLITPTSVIGGSENTLIEEDEEVQLDELAAPNMSADIAEQKDLIASLQKSAQSGNKSRKSKRALEEDGDALSFNPKEHDGMALDRQIVTNKRVGGGILSPPERKSAVWGTLAFAFGAGVALYLPSLI